MKQSTSQTHECFLELNNVAQRFSAKGGEIELFSGLNFTILQGKSYAITGPSGAGKSSLLMLMSGLAQPSLGQVNMVDGRMRQSVSKIRERIGFVFQQFHLLPELNALNNVALPLKLRGDKRALDKAKQLLKRVGLESRLKHFPSQLSGGEQQRVAIARALVFEPSFIFADEPTGNLDPNSATEIADILLQCCEEQGAGLVMVTHSQTLAAKAQYIYALKDGSCELVESNKPAAMSEVANVG